MKFTEGGEPVDEVEDAGCVTQGMEEKGKVKVMSDGVLLKIDESWHTPTWRASNISRLSMTLSDLASHIESNRNFSSVCKRNNGSPSPLVDPSSLL